MPSKSCKQTSSSSSSSSSSSEQDHPVHPDGEFNKVNAKCLRVQNLANCGQAVATYAGAAAGSCTPLVGGTLSTPIKLSTADKLNPVRHQFCVSTDDPSLIYYTGYEEFVFLSLNANFKATTSTGCTGSTGSTGCSPNEPDEVEWAVELVKNGVALSEYTTSNISFGINSKISASDSKSVLLRLAPGDTLRLNFLVYTPPSSLLVCPDVIGKWSVSTVLSLFSLSYNSSACGYDPCAPKTCPPCRPPCTTYYPCPQQCQPYQPCYPYPQGQQSHRYF